MQETMDEDRGHRGAGGSARKHKGPMVGAAPYGASAADNNGQSPCRRNSEEWEQKPADVLKAEMHPRIQEIRIRLEKCGLHHTPAGFGNRLRAPIQLARGPRRDDRSCNQNRYRGTRQG
jgi:hypothetical protein